MTPDHSPSTAVGRALRSPYAPLVAAAFAFLALGLIVALGFYRIEQQQAQIEHQARLLRVATQERARSACRGAIDVRSQLIRLLEFTGDSSTQLDPDDYTGDLRDAVERSIERGERFRKATISDLERRPAQCAGIVSLGYLPDRETE